MTNLARATDRSERVREVLDYYYGRGLDLAAAIDDGYVVFASRTPTRLRDNDRPEVIEKIRANSVQWWGDEEWTRDHLLRCHGWSPERVEAWWTGEDPTSWDPGNPNQHDEHGQEHYIDVVEAARAMPVPHLHDAFSAVATVLGGDNPRFHAVGSILEILMHLEEGSSPLV
ncbi:MAG: hypothetical protein WD646_02695 [Actinomycetota bacterium]